MKRVLSMGTPSIQLAGLGLGQDVNSLDDVLRGQHARTQRNQAAILDVAEHHVGNHV